ncbi:MAG: hypothetical protein IKY23_09760 [Lachnospiraceae bacterium]|nr:hypothetical protein [Lachnospiraceae bacterium]
MVDFKNYKQYKQKKEIEIAKQNEDSDRRNALLEELSEINTDLLETPIPEDDEKVNYELLQKRRFEEFEKYKNISCKISNEAKLVLAKWEKEDFNPFED